MARSRSTLPSRLGLGRQTMVGCDGRIDRFTFAEEIEELHGLEEIALGSNATTEKGFTGTLRAGPNRVEQICLHHNFEIRLARSRTIEDFQRRLPSIDQNFGLWVLGLHPNDEIALRERFDVGRCGCNGFEDTVKHIIELLVGLKNSHEIYPIVISARA